MSNSQMVSYTNISPNRSSPRKSPIQRITIHCYVGQVTAKRGADGFAATNRQASCNYVVGKGGDIALVVEERDRSWCSSNADNDHRAVTIEVASDSFHPYAVTDAAYAALLDLVTDICRRNGKRRLTWLGDKEKTLAYIPAEDEMVLTVHRWFANKACPGDWLYCRHGDIARICTQRLNELEKEDEEMDLKGLEKIMDEKLAVALPVYGTIRDIPEWYRPSVQKLLDKGAIQGTDPTGEVLNKSEDFCQIVTLLDRLGLLD